MKASLEHRTKWFLTAINEILNGVFIKENTEFEDMWSVKFEVKIENPYIKGFWSTTDSFKELVTNYIEQFFEVDKEKVQWNNVGTFFFFMKSDIKGKIE